MFCAVSYLNKVYVEHPGAVLLSGVHQLSKSFLAIESVAITLQLIRKSSTSVSKPCVCRGSVCSLAARR